MIKPDIGDDIICRIREIMTGFTPGDQLMVAIMLAFQVGEDVEFKFKGSKDMRSWQQVAHCVNEVAKSMAKDDITKPEIEKMLLDPKVLDAIGLVVEQDKNGRKVIRKVR